MNHMRFADWVIIRVVHLPERTKTAIEWSAIVLKSPSIGLKFSVLCINFQNQVLEMWLCIMLNDYLITT